MDFLLYAAALSLAPGNVPVSVPIEAPGPLGPLQGTLLSPSPAGGPVVLIVPGSGPTDRDGNSPLGVNAAAYRLLAEGLAAHGIASVRIDKRGMFGSSRAVANANDVTVEDYAADVHSWIAAIRSKRRVSCVWLAGHSEGGMVSLVASGNKPAHICGLILLATTGRPLGAVLKEQLRANPANAPILAQALPAVDSLERGMRVDISAMHPALQGLFNPAVQGFMISAMKVDPAKLMRSWRKPAMIVQGDRDLQVTVADARLLAAAAPKAQLFIAPGVNHVLKEVSSSDRSANLASYSAPDLPIARGMVERIAAFIQSNSRPRQRAVPEPGRPAAS